MEDPWAIVKKNPWMGTLKGECTVYWFKGGKRYTPYKSIQDF